MYSTLKRCGTDEIILVNERFYLQMKGCSDGSKCLLMPFDLI